MSRPFTLANGKKITIIKSSDGVDAQGLPILTPQSVIDFLTEETGDEVQRFSLFSTAKIHLIELWEMDVKGVTIPIKLLFEKVLLPDAAIRNWLIQSRAGKNLGALMFPRKMHDYGCKDPLMQIRYASYVNQTSIKADLHLGMFFRELGASGELQPFDASIWHKESYQAWKYMYTDAANFVDEHRPLFHRLMNTHFTDGAVLFSQMWWTFGLNTMVGKSLLFFMRDVLLHILVIHIKGDSLDKMRGLPPMFNAVSADSGQRICAKCMTSRMGSGIMMRCPCEKVYYCSAVCQKADWKVHAVVCSVAKARKQKAKVTQPQKSEHVSASVERSAAEFGTAEVEMEAWLAQRDQGSESNWLDALPALTAARDALEADMQAVWDSFLASKASLDAALAS